eukprot:gene3773-4122_t
MSLRQLVFPVLAWAEFSEILNYLTLTELWLLGCTSRAAFVSFLREKAFRKGCRIRSSQPLSSSSSSSSTCSLLPRFLGKYSLHEKVSLVSYPRSGNSFMRKLLEKETGIVTGSDSRPNRTLSSSLLQLGYQGEGVTDQSVWIVKTHYPERLGFLKLNSSRVVLLVRNPFDAIQSYFHMGMTNTHDKNLTPQAFDNLNSVWREFIINEAQVWVDFHRFWIEQQRTVPILLLRYEDLLNDEQGSLEKVIEFLRQGRVPVGLQRFMRKHSVVDTAMGYKTRNRKIGKALQVMCLDDALTVAKITQPFMDLFGYTLTSKDDQLSERVAYPASASLELKSVLLPTPSLPTTVENVTSGVIVLNGMKEIRFESDPFGRKISELRKKMTKNDTQPFEVS